jgi:hypothetical protein
MKSVARGQLERIVVAAEWQDGSAQRLMRVSTSDSSGPSNSRPEYGILATLSRCRARPESRPDERTDGMGALQPETLSHTVRIPWFPDPPCVITIAEAIVQGAMHTQHHRGQCMTRLKDFGGELIDLLLGLK